MDHIDFSLSSLLSSQVAQLTYMVEGRLNGMMEEAGKEKALNQVAEASLNEKTLKLNAVECWATIMERAWELAY